MEPLLIDSNNTKLSRYIHAQRSASAFTGQGGKHIVPNQQKKKKHKQKAKQKNKTKSPYSFFFSYFFIFLFIPFNQTLYLDICKYTKLKTIVLKNLQIRT